jgi:hypothetical protein
MFEDIDNIQSEINELNRLCDGALGTPEPEAPADPKARRLERLGILILKLLDGLLERRYFLRMEKWLKADADARKYYVEFIQLTTALHFYYHPECFTKNLPKETVNT